MSYLQANINESNGPIPLNPGIPTATTSSTSVAILAQNHAEDTLVLTALREMARNRSRSHAARRRRVAANVQYLPKHAPDFDMLIAAGLPVTLLEILLHIVVHPGLQVVEGAVLSELFCGQQAITNAFADCGFNTAPFDIETCSNLHNILSNHGFALCMFFVLRLHWEQQTTLLECLLWLAPVCSSFIFMSKGSTWRTWVNPLGDIRYFSVRKANVMASRCVLLCRLAHALGIIFILEQPISSTFHWLGRFQDMVRALRGLLWVILNVMMGAYGGSSQKSLKLWGNRQWIGQLYNDLPDGVSFTDKTITRAAVDSYGRATVTGGPGLKATQAYPPAFGRKVADEFIKHRQPVLPTPSWKTRVSLQSVRCKLAQLDRSDDWDDAKLDNVLRYLQDSWTLGCFAILAVSSHLISSHPLSVTVSMCHSL